jgi:hypothetical protein
MSLQLSLFNPTREEAFWQFHREHPEVYDELRRQALALRRAGRTHWSIRNLWEVMRQTFALQSDEEKPARRSSLATTSPSPCWQSTATG